MLYMLYGPNDYGREEFIKSLVSEARASRVDFSVGANPVLDDLVAQDLFSETQVIVLTGAAERLLNNEAIAVLAPHANHIIFVEPELDLRTKFAKTLLADNRIKAKQFVQPELEDLPDWVAESVRSLGGSIEPTAARKLCQLLGYLDPIGGLQLSLRTPSLARLRQELVKLTTYAQGEPVSVAMVTELVPSEQNYVSLAIADAVGKKNKAYLYQLLGGYYADGADDEQGKTLALIGLLADQFRSQLQVKNALENRATDADILAVTNWKPGRLFVVKRLAGAFTERQLRDGLTKLETLDVELKTSSTPPRVVMELILAQMM